jgi:hypothetical protein
MLFLSTAPVHIFSGSPNSQVPYYRTVGRSYSERTKPCDSQRMGGVLPFYCWVFLTSDITHVDSTRDVIEGRKDRRMNSSDTAFSKFQPEMLVWSQTAVLTSQLVRLRAGRSGSQEVDRSFTSLFQRGWAAPHVRLDLKTNSRVLSGVAEFFSELSGEGVTRADSPRMDWCD